MPLIGAELEEFRTRQAYEREELEAEERAAQLEEADMDGDMDMPNAGTHTVEAAAEGTVRNLCSF